MSTTSAPASASAPAPSKTPLYDWHASHGGRIVDFAGWMMPVQYSTIVEEHNATRNAVGLFDISHMGRLRFDGPGAGAYLDRIVTRRVANLAPGRIAYGLVTRDDGGILDDVLVYHMKDAAENSYWIMVCNASNRQRIVQWLKDHPADPKQVQWSDLTITWAMIAVQGPKAIELVQPLVETAILPMKYYTGVETRIAGHGGIVSRTGYTGEDGVELIVGGAVVTGIWDWLLSAGAPVGAKPAGLGCRDTLRLEAAMPLYGHELDESIDPFEAGLDFAVHLDFSDKDFPGRDALKKRRDEPGRLRRVGLSLQGKRVPREGYAVVSGGEKIGRVTSGTFSPTLQHPIAMAYVPPELTKPGTKLAIDIRGTAEPAEVVSMPFYRRK